MKEFWARTWRDPLSRLTLIVVVVALVAVSWPLAGSLLADRRITKEGELLRAPVMETRNDGTDSDPDYRVVYRLPDGLDDTRREVGVNKDAWDRARLSSSIRVRVLDEEPDPHHVEGANVSHPWRWIGLLLDLAILGGGAYLLLVWVPRRRLMATLARWEDDPTPAADPEETT